MGQLVRALLCAAAATAIIGANWVDPVAKPAAGRASAEPPLHGSSTPARASRRASTEPPLQGSGIPRSAAGAAADQSSPLEIVQWTLQHGRLILTVHGNQQAVDRLRAGEPLAIRVHWARESSAGSAPELVTELRIGSPGLASAFAAQVQHNGYFEWHSWAQKSSLGRGAWSVSLTYPDGRPVSCAGQGPCHISFNAG
jgi:hypothetical protein